LYIGYKFVTTPIVCTLSIPHGTSIAATPFTLTYTNKRLVSNPAFNTVEFKSNLIVFNDWSTGTTWLNNGVELGPVPT